MDLAQIAFVVAFEGALLVVAILLVATFVAFRRMNHDVRKARMFIMADRVMRFLGAFTVAFVVIAADVAIGVLSLPDAVFIGAGAVVVFLAAILYGSLELFLVVRPPRKAPAPRRAVQAPSTQAMRDDPSDGETHASR